MKQVMKKIVTLLTILVLLPVSIATAQPSNGKHRVILDVGHGGSDAGVIIKGKYHEKDLALAIATELKKELDKAGNVNTLLSRSADQDLNFTERKNRISASRSDIVIGIHVNAAFGRDASGYELYLPDFTDETSSRVSSNEILDDMVKNRYLNDSIKMARLIQKNMETVFPRKSRGLRNAPFVLFEGLKSPAVVLEVGFATNQDDRKLLMDEKVRTSVAHALSQSIIEYF
jgi:N-acetylmuramoyl-L-alanine amidase